MYSALRASVASGSSETKSEDWWLLPDFEVYDLNVCYDFMDFVVFRILE